jgi:hypothetical protein
MDTFPLDIDPAQVLRWLKAEYAAVPSLFRVTATRGSEERAMPLGKEAHLGDVEREDLSEIATIATLEIAPAHAAEGWSLMVMVEDELGPRTGGGTQRIDLGTFDREFIRPGRGIAAVYAEVDGAAGRAKLDRLIAAIEKNSHPSERAARGRGRSVPRG